MSDGLSDARAIGDLDADVRRAARKLADTLREAKRGHRGMIPGDVLGTANAALRGAGVRLVWRKHRVGGE